MTVEMTDDKSITVDEFVPSGSPVHVIMVDTDGRIAQSCTQHIELAERTSKALGLRLIQTEEFIGPDRFYLGENDQVIPIPPRPSRRHKFDFSKKQWLIPSFGYADDRAAEYPSMVEFADAFYWSQRGKPEKMQAWLQACDAVKQKFPKV